MAANHISRYTDRRYRQLEPLQFGRTQSEAKPMIARRSGPLNHRIPSVGLSNETGTTDSDLGGSLPSK